MKRDEGLAASFASFAEASADETGCSDSHAAIRRDCRTYRS
jgi:hypothetical protein